MYFMKSQDSKLFLVDSFCGLLDYQPEINGLIIVEQWIQSDVQ